MNIRRCAWALLIGGLMALGCAAQEPDRNAPPEGREGRPNHPHSQAERGEGLGGPMTERWLQHLQTDRPDEFARLRELRETNPPAFRQEMRRHMRQEIGKKLQREHPAVFAAIEGLPEEDHEWLMGRLFGGEERGAHGPGMTQGFSPGGVRPDDGEGELRGLARAYRSATNDQDRARTSRALREKLQQSYTAKSDMRRQELDQMDAKLKEARAFLQERAKNREAIIDRRLKELTEAPPPSP